MREVPIGAVMRRFSRFVALTPSDEAALAGLAALAEPYSPRRTVISEGRRCDSMYLIVEGWAAEFRILPNGDRQILKVRLPGEVVGIDCLVYGVSLHSLQTLTPAKLARITADEYRRLRRLHPRLDRALFLMGLFERAIGHEWIVSLGRRPAWSRIGHLLLEIAERCRVSGLSGTSTPFPLTQQDVADCTGLTLGYVNRVLCAMRNRGLVSIRPRELTIMDTPALTRLAGFEALYLSPGDRVDHDRQAPARCEPKSAADPAGAAGRIECGRAAMSPAEWSRANACGQAQGSGGCSPDRHGRSGGLGGRHAGRSRTASS